MSLSNSMRPASDVSRRINAERLLLIAWVRAILLQFAHPLIGAAVADHSTFRVSGPAASTRLRQTLDAMLALTFGTEAERDAAVEDIRAIHRRVHGVLAEPCGRFPAGTRYSAEDSALLTWVHATLVESMVLTYEQLIAPLTAAERDRYCDDAAELAVALGASPPDVPRSWSELRAHIDDRYALGEIAVGQQALALSAALLSPFRRWPVRRLAAALLSLIAAGQLPSRLRIRYGFRWSRRRARRFRRTLFMLRVLRRVLPERIAWWKRARAVHRIPVRHRYSTAAR